MSNLPKSFFDTKIKALQNRLRGLLSYLEKAIAVNDSKKVFSIQKEITETKIHIKKTEIESNFARLE